MKEQDGDARWAAQLELGGTFCLRSWVVVAMSPSFADTQPISRRSTSSGRVVVKSAPYRIGRCDKRNSTGRVIELVPGATRVRWRWSMGDGTEEKSQGREKASV